MNRSGLMRLGAAWATVAVFLVFGKTLTGDLSNPLLAVGLFAWLMGVIVWAAFGVVHEAEELAERLGEPYGTLILTLAIVIIEVALISAVMLGAKEAATLGRDTMFAVLMIVLNGVVGIGLIVGGLRHHQQSYNLQGASAYLAVIIPLTIISLVLPNFTVSTADGSLSTVQAVFFSIFTLALYGIFLVLQTGRHQGFFIYPPPNPKGLVAANPQASAAKPPSSVTAASAPPADPDAPVPAETASPVAGPEAPTGGRIWPHTLLLLATILPIVILSKSLATVLDHGIAELGAPPALGGVLIALVVFTPEGISALRAVAANQLQRAVNLCLGAATSTLGLTVPAVLAIGLLTGQQVILGLSTTNMVLLATTLILNTLTFSGPRTTVLEGAVHLVMFFVFVVLVFSP